MASNENNHRGGAIVLLSVLGFIASIASCVGDDPAEGDAGSDAASDVVTDVAPLDVSAPDASTAACDLNKPFGTPVALPAPFNNSGSSSSISFLPDMLTAFFTNNNSSDGGILGLTYVTTRSSVDASFSSPTADPNINEVGTGYGANSLLPTADGLTVFFGNGFTGGYTAWVGTRASTTSDFTPKELASPINVGGENFPAWITSDGGTLYFVSNRAGGQGGRDIWIATRPANGTFATPSDLLNPVNTDADEQGIVLSADELQAFITRGSTLYYTSRASASAPFSAPTAITELNAFSSPLSVTWVTPDGCTLYFTGPIPDSGSHYDIYMATRGE